MSFRLPRFLRRLYHYAAYAVAGAVIVVCLAALIFKFWVMPRIAEFGPMLEESASRAVGQPVKIGRLEADWHGLNPRVILLDVRMTPPAGAPLLLPRVEAVLSWLSLPLLDARLSSLNLDQPRLAVWRDAAGVVYVAGIPVNVPSTPSPFPDWLLKQPRIVVKDAEITWRDEKLGAPELRFDRIRLLLENRFGRHRFGGIASPSEAAARRLELRGDLRGGSVHDLNRWTGEMYARVDQARFDAWGQWVPWAQESVKAGVGSMRFWLTLGGGQVTSLSGDAYLERVAINLQQDLPDMAFDSLSGHIGWSRDQDSRTFFVDRLRFKIPGAAPIEPASVRVVLTPDAQGGFKRVGGSARNLRLEALTALTGALPLPRRGHDLIEALNPRGLVEFGEGHWAGPADYAFKLRLREAGARAYENFPGFSGFSLRVEADQGGGEAVLEGGDSLLEWPRVFRHELVFTKLEAKADWKIEEHGTHIEFAADRLVNADLDGSAAGRVDLPRGEAPRVDMRARLTRGEARAVYRYLPHAVADDAYQWLKQSLLGGRSDDTRLILKGPLDRFPFDRGGGEFKVSVNMLDGVLDYAPGWPRIEGVRGMLVFHDKGMTLNADSGRILDVGIGPVRAVIPDLHSGIEEILTIEGRAAGETRAFLDFIRRSPVHDYTGRFTEQFKAVGNGELAINLRMPLRNVNATGVSGSYALLENRIDPGGDLPDLEQVTGSVAFTDKAMQAKGVRVRVLGQAALLDIGSQPGGQVRVRMAGRIGAEALAPYLPATLAGRLSGGTGWSAEIGMNASQKTELAVTSDLVGLSVDLPAPFAKRAEQVVPLSVSRQPGENGMDQLRLRYGDLLGLRAQLPGSGQARVNLRLGAGEVAAPTEPGLWISGGLRSIDLDAWRRIDLGEETGKENKLLLREANLTFGELRLFQRRLHDTYIRLRPSGGGWQIGLTGREITGEIKTLPQDKGMRVFANFKRLGLPDPEPGAAGAESLEDAQVPSNLLALELSAASLVWKERELGELRLRLSPDARGLRVDNFVLKTGDDKLEAKGLVANHPRRPTRLGLTLESDNLGKLLGRLGSPGRIKGGATRVAGSLGWTGGIEDFNFATLEGDLDIAVKQGQFLKVDPGAGRLLGILSLQALPRRIALDFRDVFSEGFAFDEIVGDVHLERGSLYAKDLRMNGPSAKVRMSGVTDLARETQNLRVTIQPRLEDTVAVAGALLGGPVVGLGTLLAGKVLQNPIGQAATFEYAVSGSWGEPVIAKVPRPRAENEAQP